MPQSYLDEIGEQPAALGRLPGLFGRPVAEGLEQLRLAIGMGQVSHLVITGMGGSLYSAYGTWLRLSQSLPIPVSLWDTSELVQQAPGVLKAGTAVIAISQSGESIELRRMTEIDAATKHRISITNGTDNSLANWATLKVATQVGPERTVSTKTYTAGLAAVYAVEAGLLGKLPKALKEIKETASAVSIFLAASNTSSERVLQFLGHQNQITFLARGASVASANMAALVAAEAAKAPTQALTCGQFRHGPLELVREGFKSVLFMGDEPTRLLNETTLADITRLGGRCLVIGSKRIELNNPDLMLHVGLPEIASGLLPILEILPIQLLMVPMAGARGYVAGQFLNGSKVTTIE